MTDTTLPADAGGNARSKSFTRYLPHIPRILMALLFLFAGLNGFLHFVPAPATMPEFALALMKTRYMFPMIMGTQLVVGVLLALNRFVPLALVLIAPVVVNIVAFHIFIDRSGLAVAVVLLAMELYLIWAYRKAYRPLFVSRATPGDR